MIMLVVAILKFGDIDALWAQWYKRQRRIVCLLASDLRLCYIHWTSGPS